MTEKYIITRCGGENCPCLGCTEEYEQTGITICGVDKKYNPECEHCPHGITIPEAADIMLRFGLLGRNFDYPDLPAQRQQREEELEHLLEVQNGKKQN